jgi:hypothetical protein
MDSSLFWNKPPERNLARSVDPLGFDALRDAISDKLVPLLTGATRDADEYLWTIVGLRWAHKKTGSSVDATLFNQGFALFERALKQYWYKWKKRKSSGIEVVEKLCDEPQPNVRRPILVNQRGTGLLGSYIVSLRNMGLVHKSSLRLVEDEADRLISDVGLLPRQNYASSWVTLRNAFSAIDFKEARSRLGLRLFGRIHQNNQAMTLAACAALAKPASRSWDTVATKLLGMEQARLAKITRPLVRLEAAALEAFAELLRGKTALGSFETKNICALAANVYKSDPFPSSWSRDNRLRLAISNALSLLASGKDPAAALMDLHTAVTRDIRHKTPWLRHLGDIPPEFQKWRPGSDIPDFRFANLRTLLKQTRWKPHAF